MHIQLNRKNKNPKVILVAKTNQNQDEKLVECVHRKPLLPLHTICFLNIELL